jgi:hypothetical protein
MSFYRDSICLTSDLQFTTLPLHHYTLPAKDKFARYKKNQQCLLVECVKTLLNMYQSIYQIIRILNTTRNSVET